MSDQNTTQEDTQDQEKDNVVYVMVGGVMEAPQDRR